MAAGKSTVGQRLGARLGWEFIDFDELIAVRTGLTAGALIRERGEDAFRVIEEDITVELAGRDRVVLAPGGGWSTKSALAGKMGPGTFRVWLRISAAEAARRAAADPVERPLLAGSVDTEPALERVSALLRQREAVYATADLVVDVDRKTSEAVVDEILLRLGITREDDES